MGRALGLRVAGPIVLAACGLLAGCSGVSTGPNNNSQAPSGSSAGTLSVTPATLNFGNVAVGSSSALTGTLSAGSSDVVVSSAAWNGSGYAVSGITFPATVPAGTTVQYTVTFTPPAAGASSGSVSFTSNASDASLSQAFSGTGAQPSTHTVSLSWDPSTSTVIGYNLYRATQSGGPYAKVNPALLSATSYTDSDVLSGTTYYYVATAVNSSQIESGYSNQTSAAVP